MNISEVSRKFDITPDALRYYEKIGLLPRITRSESGIRNYSRKDIEWVEFIKCMRNAGLTIESLIEYVKLFNQGDDTVSARKDILVNQRKALVAKMSEMNKSLEVLDYKISIYETKFLDKEKNLRKDR